MGQVELITCIDFEGHIIPLISGTAPGWYVDTVDRSLHSSVLIADKEYLKYVEDMRMGLNYACELLVVPKGEQENPGPPMFSSFKSALSTAQGMLKNKVVVIAGQAVIEEALKIDEVDTMTVIYTKSYYYGNEQTIKALVPMFGTPLTIMADVLNKSPEWFCKYRMGKSKVYSEWKGELMFELSDGYVVKYTRV